MSCYENEFFCDLGRVCLSPQHVDATGEIGRIEIDGRAAIPGSWRPIESTWTSVEQVVKNCGGGGGACDETCIVYEQPEGTRLRVFWAAGRWFVSTSTRLNAHASFWGSRQSHGDVFLQYIADVYPVTQRDFWAKLDRARAYYFWIEPTLSNRVVFSNTDESGLARLVYAGSHALYEMDAGAFRWPWQGEELREVRALSLVALVEGVKPRSAFVHVRRGVSVAHKFWNESYLALKCLRGDDRYPARRYCYLCATEPVKAVAFGRLFSEVLTTLDESRASLDSLVTAIIRRPSGRRVVDLVNRVRHMTRSGPMPIYRSEWIVALIANCHWDKLTNRMALLGR
jgi:hypothetical protein